MGRLRFHPAILQVSYGIAAQTRQISQLTEAQSLTLSQDTQMGQAPRVQVPGPVYQMFHLPLLRGTASHSSPSLPKKFDISTQQYASCVFLLDRIPEEVNKVQACKITGMTVAILRDACPYKLALREAHRAFLL